MLQFVLTITIWTGTTLNKIRWENTPKKTHDQNTRRHTNKHTRQHTTHNPSTQPPHTRPSARHTAWASTHPTPTQPLTTTPPTLVEGVWGIRPTEGCILIWIFIHAPTELCYWRGELHLDIERLRQLSMPPLPILILYNL